MPVVRRNTRRSVSDQGSNYLIRQLDELQRIAGDYRRTFLGDEFFNDARDFYNLTVNQSSRAPSFRPRLEIPQLQMNMCTEASDLADSEPVIYITQEQNGKAVRDEKREKVFQNTWRDGFFNIQIMYASLWSLLAGNGYLQAGYDRLANSGRGKVWLKSRDPETVYADPAATDDQDWYFVQIVDRLYPNQIRDLYPQRGFLVDAPPPSLIEEAKPTTTLSPHLIMPPGPMSAAGTMPEEKIGIGDGRLKLRTTFIFDPTLQDVVKQYGGNGNGVDKIVPAKFEKKYPNGRMIVDADELTLFDGDNPYPRKKFPLTRVCGLPPLNSFYAPPPIRVSKNLQETAQRMLVQAFENAVRLNNGVWFIDASTGITAEDFGGLPGELRIINANARYPQLTLPKPFPPQFIEYPKFLLQLQQQLQGFPDSRQGKQGSGNVSVDLYSEAIFHAQSLTRLRAKLLAESVYKCADQLFVLMAHFNPGHYAPDYSGEFQLIPWERIDKADEWQLWLDPGSIQPISQMALNKLALALKDKHMVDDRTALEWMRVPHSNEIADRLESERSLEAMARVRRGGR